MKLQKLYLLIAPLAAWLLLGTACQSARSMSLLPPAQANAPALSTPTKPAPLPQVVAQAEPKAAEAAPAPKADPAADLLTQVDKEYQAGLASFKAGQVEAAKKSYNHALDLLTKGEIDPRSDTRLQRELDLVQTAIKAVGQQESQQAEASDEQPAEPAPIDEANDITPPVDAGTKAKAEAEMRATHSDLPLMMTDQVAGYIAYYSGRGRERFESALVRSGRYREMIQKTLKEEGVPQDLIYLAQAESGFHPLALSRAGARGMWQFMGSRGRGYGLHRTKWTDDRQDPEMATRAAAKHLRDLYKQFGDWYLAMAAYNSGPGNVQRAVKRTGYADFWELYRRNVLPRETRNYVPIILAVTIMAKNPAQYGLDTLVLDQPIPFESVKIDYPVDLRLVAQCLDVPPSTLQELNPRLLRWTTPETGGFELHLPAGTRKQYEQAIALIPAGKRVWWRYHKVAPGDTLYSIARAYRTAPKLIAQQNNLEISGALEPESHLVVPIAAGKHAISEDAQTYARRITRYRVRRGDTVETVADNFNVPPKMVRRWNRLRGNSLGGRRILYLHLPVSPAAASKQVASKSSRSNKLQSTPTPARHEVKAGETLYSIANLYHTTVKALQEANGHLAVLKPGMILVIR